MRGVGGARDGGKIVTEVLPNVIAKGSDSRIKRILSGYLV